MFQPHFEEKNTQLQGRKHLPLPKQSYLWQCDWAFDTAPIGCTKGLIARTYTLMKETTDLDIDLECSLAFDGNGIKPYLHVYCLEGLLIEDV